MKKFGTIMIACAVMLVLIGFGMTVSADRAPNQTPETQGITTSTAIICTGTVTNTANMVWVTSSEAAGGAPLSAQEVQSTTSYSENTIASNGYVSYTKEFGVDTANKVANQNNVQSSRIIEFIASGDGNPMGRMISDESLMIDNVGLAASTSDYMLCPFGSSSSSSIPAFCNIVEAGSSLDMTEVSVASQASSRTIAASADVPVALSYHIKAQGFDGYPAQGSISAYIKSHIQEGRGDGVEKAEDLAFSETSTASGEVTLFDKLMEYNSGMRRNA